MLKEGIATIRGEKGSVGLSGQGDGFAELRVTGRYIARGERRRRADKSGIGDDQRAVETDPANHFKDIVIVQVQDCDWNCNIK